MTDDNGCWKSASVTLTQPVVLTSTAAVTSNYNGRNIRCFGATDGEATATPAGGTAPYTYEWFTDAAMTVSTGKTTQIAAGLAAGAYWVKVKDINLCEASASVTVTEPADSDCHCNSDKQLQRKGHQLCWLNRRPGHCSTCRRHGSIHL